MLHGGSARFERLLAQLSEEHVPCCKKGLRTSDMCLFRRPVHPSGPEQYAAIGTAQGVVGNFKVHRSPFSGPRLLANQEHVFSKFFHKAIHRQKGHRRRVVFGVRDVNIKREGVAGSLQSFSFLRCFALGLAWAQSFVPFFHTFVPTKPHAHALTKSHAFLIGSV